MEAEDLPDALEGQTEVLFANIQDIYNFHSQQLLPELEKSAKNPDAVPKVFFKYVSITSRVIACNIYPCYNTPFDI